MARAAVLANREAAMDGLRWEEESGLVTFVTLPAQRADGVADAYLARFSFVYYPDWPPSVTFVNPSTRAYDPAYWPKINNSDRMALHPEYGDAPAGLICNSMFFEYYFWGGHAQQAGQCWEKGRHTMAATVAELRIHLSQPYYIGPNR